MNLSELEGNAPMIGSPHCNWFVCNPGDLASLNYNFLIHTIDSILPIYLLCRLR